MIVALYNTGAPTPKGCHGFPCESCHPFGIWDGYLQSSTIVSSLRDWTLHNLTKQVTRSKNGSKFAHPDRG